MIINPKKIIEKGILKVENTEEQVQQNGIDLTIDQIFKIIPNKSNLLLKDARSHCERIEVLPDEKGFLILEPGHYDILYSEKINLPNGISSIVFPRSTVNRGGNFITSGWYDAGFSGRMGGVLHVTQGDLIVEKGVRIAQMIFMDSEEGDLYNGIYNKNTTTT